MNPNASLRAFLLGTFFVVIFAIISAMSSFKWLNHQLHDFALDFSYQTKFQPNTLLIQTALTRDSTLDIDLPKLFLELEKHDPASIIVMADSDFAVRELEQLSLSYPQVYPSWVESPHLNSRIEAFKLVRSDGINRLFEQSNDNFLSHTQKPAKRNEATFVGIPQYFDFFIGMDMIPNLTLRQALEGGIIEELVKDKIIIVSINIDSTYAKYSHPEFNGRTTSTFGELQALATETVIANSALIDLSPLTVFVILLVVYLINFVILQLLTPNGLLIYGSLSLFFVLALFTLSLIQWHLFLPVAEIIIVQLFSIPYFILVKRFRDEASILSISSDVNNRLSKRMQPKSFYDTSEPWQELHALINQQLDITRSVFLEKVPGDHRIKEIHALNCSLDDIQERRRDFERTPYSTAITKGSAIQLSSNNYFKSKDKNEVDYLIPLVFSGSVLGFWALTILPEKEWSAPLFEKHLHVFSSEIAELLFLRAQFLRKEQENKNILRQFMFLKLAQVEYEALDDSVALLEKRYDALINVFDGMSTALTVFNLFGYIVYANNRMEKLAQDISLPIFTLSAHDFLKKMTDLKSEEIKKQLRIVSIEGESIDYQISDARLSSDYVLRVRPINVVQQQEQTRESPLMLLGVLFEFIDVTNQQRVISQKKDLFGQYFHQTRNQISAMNLLCRRIKKESERRHSAEQSTDSEDKLNDSKNRLDTPYLDLLVETLNETTRLNHNVEEQMEKHRSLSPQVTPISPISLLRKMINQFDHLIKKKNIHFEIKIPSLMSLVLAEAQQLENIFESVLQVVIDDCPDTGGIMSVVVKDTKRVKDHRVIYMDFTNNGYGMPQKELDSMMLKENSNLSLSDNYIEQLIYNVRNAKYWGMEMELNCDLDKGFHIQLMLPVFDVESQSRHL